MISASQKSLDAEILATFVLVLVCVHKELEDACKSHQLKKFRVGKAFQY